MGMYLIVLWVVGIFFCIIPWGLLGSRVYIDSGDDLGVYGLLVQACGLGMIISVLVVTIFAERCA